APEIGPYRRRGDFHIFAVEAALAGFHEERNMSAAGRGPHAVDGAKAIFEQTAGQFALGALQTAEPPALAVGGAKAHQRLVHVILVFAANVASDQEDLGSPRRHAQVAAEGAALDACDSLLSRIVPQGGFEEFM